MSNVTREDIKNGVKALGINIGDTVLVHSSYKSLGTVEGGAESVISGFLDALGNEGTLVFPTFCQKDFRNAYKTWHMDKESDVGYLTNYFRKRPGSMRSDHATHSVAACGRDAEFLTETHGHTHKRFGSMGDTNFSADSPWEKMYLRDAKVVLLGVEPLYVTFRHYAEYVFIEECLKNIENSPEYEAMRSELWSYEKPGGPWPHICSEWLAGEMKKHGMVREVTCGNAILTCLSSKTYVDMALEFLRENKKEILWVNDSVWNVSDWNDWYGRIKGLKRGCGKRLK